ncbi:MAG: hypothetical protein NC409_13400 [Clostridium sp.]|nr:hypothetical protein [Clostridium sp.]
MNCCRCGKSFDYEKHNGICPKCAAYNRPQGQTPYDYDVDKDISAHYETMDDSHERLHRMYDSAPAHQPEKQHAQYHRQYDDNYRHPQYSQGQSYTQNDRSSQSQGAGSAPNYRTNQPQGMGSASNYQMNQPQNGGYPMQGAGGRNAPQRKKTKSVVGKVILMIFIIDMIIAFLQMILQ